MRAITVRQPWAWAILNARKDIENRDWYTHFRGKVAVHAALGITRVEYMKASKYIRTINRRVEIPILERLERGAIIGVVEIKDCVQESYSLWFEGKYGFVLACSKLLREPIPCKGGSGLWNVPEDVECRIKQTT